MGQMFFSLFPTLRHYYTLPVFPYLALAERGQNILIYQESELQTALNLLSKRMLPSYFSWQALTATL